MPWEHYVFCGQNYKHKDRDRSVFLFTQLPPALATVILEALTQPRGHMAGIFALERELLRKSSKCWL